ncbi:hypothetical protein F4820DRAFT_107222 [Hypoxylon rubiginosum]|uniref:Uncharacterized protein n=1 Tax=Hypoxylon rubiginosum TaxID=110542 RepID=A0ACB9YND9_9PEZI|nr:hypothetical protein F4820DRAFT_107222 [Hypoxylon rubiginosum]
MEAPHTPPQPTTATDHAQHTGPLQPITPSNLTKQNKKRKPANVQPPPVIDLTGKDASRHKNDIASAAIMPHLNEMDRLARINKQVLGDLAKDLDAFVGSYKGDHLSEHRAQARSFVGMLVGHLNTAVFSATNGSLYASIRIRSSQPTTSSE